MFNLHELHHMPAILPAIIHTNTHQSSEQKKAEIILRFLVVLGELTTSLQQPLLLPSHQKLNCCHGELALFS